MSERLSSLMYTIRFPVVLKYEAQMILVQAGLILLPFCLAIFYAEYTQPLNYLAMSSLLFLLALPSIRLPVPSQIQTNEAFAITVITFMTGAAVMVYPFMGRVAFFGCLI